MIKFLTPFRVGIVVIAGVFAGALLIMFIGKRGFSAGDTYKVYATFNDASGLGPKSRVQIAGIEVGVVDSINLTEDAHALVLLRIRKDVVLHADAKVTKRSASLLGDFLLDIYPGTSASPRLKDGDTINKAVNQPGMEDVFAALGDVTRDIQGVTHSLRDLLSSDEVGSIKDIIKSMNKVANGLNTTIVKAGGRLDLILGDVAHLTGVVRALADNQGGNVQEILGNVKTFTVTANRIVNGIDAIVGAGGDQLKESVASIKDTLNELQKALRSAEGAVDSVKGTVDDTHQIVADVKAGKGTIGKLLTDDTIANNLSGTFGALSNILTPLSHVRLDARLQGEVHYRPLLPKDYDRPFLKGGAAVRLITDPSFYYGFDVLSDPRGSSTREVSTTSTPGVKNSAVTQQSVVTTDNWKVSAFISKRVGPVAFRAGVIESSGGVGMDLYAAKDHVRFMVDAFDFSNVFTPYPRLRATAQFSFLKHVFVNAGVDDILNITPQMQAGKLLVGIDGFVGGGVSFTDEDVAQVLKAAGGK